MPTGSLGGIGFAAGAINGYLLNRRWTFGSPDSWRTRIRYVVVQLGGLFGSAGLLWVFVSSLSIGRVAAYGVVIPVITIATFLVNRNWTYSAGNVVHADGLPQAREPRVTLAGHPRPGNSERMTQR